MTSTVLATFTTKYRSQLQDAITLIQTSNLGNFAEGYQTTYQTREQLNAPVAPEFPAEASIFNSGSSYDPTAADRHAEAMKEYRHEQARFQNSGGWGTGIGEDKLWRDLLRLLKYAVSNAGTSGKILSDQDYAGFRGNPLDFHATKYLEQGNDLIAKIITLAEPTLDELVEKERRSAALNQEEKSFVSGIAALTELQEQMAADSLTIASIVSASNAEVTRAQQEQEKAQKTQADAAEQKRVEEQAAQQEAVNQQRANARKDLLEKYGAGGTPRDARQR